ncbi:MAG: glycine cleavage system aminomethyltransferase GcvT [Acidobacteriota bacterium]|jgi:aminomethyltransferase
MDSMKKTPLNAEHRALGARMVDFGGWDMPVQYTSIVEEHTAVRTAAGLFDVSHMGEVWIEGPQALDYIQFMTSNDASRLSDNQIQYSGLLTEKGCFVDDLLVYRISGERFLLVVNAANTGKDFAWIKSFEDRFDAKAENHSDRTAQIAVQGPRAESILQEVLPDLELGAIKYYWFRTGRIDGEDAIVSRTGYTGEDGFEVYLPPDKAPALWKRLLDAGKTQGLLPAGLGARDTLRLESAMALYGNDIDDTTTVLEADLAWILKLSKPSDFNGRTVLERQKEAGVSRKLVGFEMVGRGIPRHGYGCLVGGEHVGTVTSGTQAPFLKKAIGMAYLPVEAAEPGTEFEIDIRGRKIGARVVKKPFYKRPK